MRNKRTFYSNLYSDLGKKIRIKRMMLGYSLEKLSEITGIKKNNLSIIENEKTTPTLKTLDKIFKALDIDIDITVDYKVNKF